MVRHRAGVAAPTLFRERFLPRIAATQQLAVAAWHARALHSIVMAGRTAHTYRATLLCLHDRLITFPELIMVRY